MHAVIVSILTLFLCYSTLNADTKEAVMHQPSATIEGTLLYRERVMLPSGASVTVTLEDFPYTDIPATRIATKTFDAPKASPIVFSLSYDPAKLDPNRRYTLNAVIAHKGTLLFRSRSHVDPFKTPLRILLKRATSKSRAVPIANIHWKLRHIEGVSIASSEKLKDPNFILKPENKVIGFTGCNRFVGTYELNAEQIRFSEISATPMQCSQTMQTEHAFKNVLQQTRRFKRHDDTLELFDDHHVIASFRAVYF